MHILSSLSVNWRTLIALLAMCMFFLLVPMYAAEAQDRFVDRQYSSEEKAATVRSLPDLNQMILDLKARVAALEAKTQTVQNKVSPYTIGGTRPSTESNRSVFGTYPTAPSVQPPTNTTNLFNRNMGLGTRGEKVVGLQNCLAELDYFSGETANVYGPKTVKAVKRFQAAKGIVRNGNAWTTGYGYLGPKTRMALNQSCQTTASRVDPNFTSTLPLPPNTNLFTVTPASGIAPLAVTFKSKFSGRGGVPKIYFGDGTSEDVATCSAPADRCIDFGVNTHTYKKAGTYSVKVKDTRQLYHRKTIIVKAANTVFPRTISGDPMVDLQFEIYGDDAGFYSVLPRKVAALRKVNLKWDTENVNNCKLTLAYENDRVTKKITKTSGEMRVDRVKPYDKLGLDYVKLTCDDKDRKQVSKKINVDFYSKKADARVYVNGDEKKTYNNVTREEALSRCLAIAVTRTYKDKAVGCVFDDRIIYQHGDDPFPKSLIRVIDEDAEVYEDGDDADADEGEEDTTGFLEKIGLKAVKSGREVALRLGVDDLVCDVKTGSQQIGILDWDDGTTEVLDWFCDSKNFKQTNAHTYAKPGIYSVKFTTKELGTTKTLRVSVGDVRGISTSVPYSSLEAALSKLESSVDMLQSSLGL